MGRSVQQHQRSASLAQVPTRSGQHAKPGLVARRDVRQVDDDGGDAGAEGQGKSAAQLGTGVAVEGTGGA